MSIKQEVYVDLDGEQYDLQALDADARCLFEAIQKSFKAALRSTGEPIQRWCDFDNGWMPLVDAYCKLRRVLDKNVTKTPIWRIATDLSGRLAVELGLARKGDYRDRLRRIIVEEFRSQREFCKATGISEDMLSHVLAGRKDLSMEALSKALERIGYTIRFAPTGKRRKKSA